MSMRDQGSQRFHEQAQRARGRCAETGPWGYVCTENSGHDFAHYDASLDASWTHHWHDEFDVPVENHPFDCRCDEHPEPHDSTTGDTAS